jgi:hypothetical protein
MTGGRQIAALWGVVALLLVAMSPWAPQLAAGAPGCPVKSISGLPCPTCGATRAAVALAELDLLAAVALNPLVAAAWMGLVVGGLAALLWSVTGRQLPSVPRRLPLAPRLAFVAAVAVNWFYLVIAGT